MVIESTALDGLSSSRMSAPEAAQAARSFVADVRSGRIDGSRPASAGIALPATGAGLDAAGVERFVDEVDELLRHDEPLLALRRLLLIEKLVTEAGLPPLRERGDARVDAVLRTETELDPMLRTMLDDTWTFVGRKSQLQAETWMRQPEGGRLAVKVCGVLPHPVERLAACLLHPDLFSTWLPGVARATEIHRPSNFRMAIYLRAIHVPLPFIAPRDTVLVGYGDIYSATSVIVYLRSLDEGDARLDAVAPQVAKESPAGSTVRLDIEGGFIFEMLPDGTTKLQATIALDIKMKMVPPALIDWFLKHVAANLIPMYHKQAQKFEPGGKLEHLMTTSENAATYEEMRRRLSVLTGV